MMTAVRVMVMMIMMLMMIIRLRLKILMMAIMILARIVRRPIARRNSGSRPWAKQTLDFVHAVISLAVCLNTSTSPKELNLASLDHFGL